VRADSSMGEVHVVYWHRTDSSCHRLS